VVVGGDHFGDGEDYPGVVQSIDDGGATILFDDDGSEDTVPIENLTAEETEEEETEEAAFSVGDAVATTGDFFGDGETYTGTIDTIDGETATVAFEDGTMDDVPFSNLETA